MRTKVLCAAALAAGALTSMAQVYSANIVGYVNVPVSGGYKFLSNPLDAAPNNAATNVLVNATTDPSGNSGYIGTLDGSSIALWTGVNFNTAYFDSVTADTTTGFTDQAGNPVPCPTIGSGAGFLFNNQSAGLSTLTFVGQVRTGTNTLALATQPHPFSVGSMLPLSGGVITGLGMTNPTTDPSGNSGYIGSLDGAFVELLLVNGNGGAKGYDVSYFDSVTADTTTGFTDQAGNPKPEPQVPMGGGFFFVNQSSAGTYNWTQVLNP